MGMNDRGIAEIQGEMIPAPKRAFSGKGVLRSVENVAVSVRGFRLDVAGTVAG